MYIKLNTARLGVLSRINARNRSDWCCSWLLYFSHARFSHRHVLITDLYEYNTLLDVRAAHELPMERHPAVHDHALHAFLGAPAVPLAAAAGLTPLFVRPHDVKTPRLVHILKH